MHVEVISVINDILIYVNCIHGRYIQGAKTHRMPESCRSIFCTRAANYRAFFRKMTYKDKASYGSSPPCTYPPHTNTCTSFLTDMTCSLFSVDSLLLSSTAAAAAAHVGS